MANEKFVQYGNQKLPMGELTLEQAKAIMARHFPELASDPKVETKKEGETTIYVFSKGAGRKGAGRKQTPGQQCLARLQAVQETPVLSPDDMGMGILDHAGSLSSTAVAQLRTEAEHVKTVRETLEALAPIGTTSGGIL